MPSAGAEEEAIWMVGMREDSWPNSRCTPSMSPQFLDLSRNADTWIHTLHACVQTHPSLSTEHHDLFIITEEGKCAGCCWEDLHVPISLIIC